MTKRVFCVHSNLSYLCSLAVIEIERLAPESIIFLTLRDFNPPPNQYRVLKLRQIWEPQQVMYPAYLKSGLFWFIWLIKTFKFQSISLYIPNSKIFPLYLLSNISLTKEINYIDEGLLFYSNRPGKFGGKRKNHSILHFFSCLMLGKYKNNYYFLSDVNKTYAFSAKVNNHFKNVQLVNLPKIATDNFYNKEKSIILVFDGLVPLGFLTPNEYNLVLEKLAEETRKYYGNIKVYYKIHPAYYYAANERQKLQSSIMQLFSENKCEPLHENTMIENLLSMENIILLTGFSTIGFLCYENNRHYKSYLNIYLEQNLLINKINELPTDYVINATTVSNISQKAPLSSKSTS